MATSNSRRKSCPSGKTINPRTGRCVLKKGSLGKKISKRSPRKISSRKPARKTSPKRSPRKTSPKKTRKTSPKKSPRKSTPQTRGGCLKQRVYIKPGLVPQVPIEEGNLIKMVEKWYRERVMDQSRMFGSSVSVKKVDYDKGYITVDMTSSDEKAIDEFSNLIEDPDDDGNHPIKYQGEDHTIYGSIRMKKCLK
jgi:hypothetical protein